MLIFTLESLLFFEWHVTVCVLENTVSCFIQSWFYLHCGMPISWIICMQWKFEYAYVWLIMVVIICWSMFVFMSYGLLVYDISCCFEKRDMVKIMLQFLLFQLHIVYRLRLLNIKHDHAHKLSLLFECMNYHDWIICFNGCFIATWSYANFHGLISAFIPAWLHDHMLLM